MSSGIGGAARWRRAMGGDRRRLGGRTSGVFGLWVDGPATGVSGGGLERPLRGGDARR